MNEKEKTVHCFIAFFDVRGFGSFDRRVTHAETEILPWRRQWRTLIEDFETKTDYLVKRLGDGTAIFHEVEPARAGMEAPKFLKNCNRFLYDMKKICLEKRSPRPDGVRLRAAYGPIWREPCKQIGCDYFGYKVNLVERMIHQHKEECFNVHESIVEILTTYQKRKHGFKFLHVGIDNRAKADAIYTADLKLQWGFRHRRRR